MGLRWTTILALAAMLSIPHTQPAGAQVAGDWPGYSRDLAGTRHSPLDQINAGNVANLSQAWTYPIGSLPPSGIGGGSQFTPVVVDGVMYLGTSSGIVALEPETGRQVWQYEVSGDRPSQRGIAYWPGDGTLPARLFFTSGVRLFGVSAHTGEAVSGFGDAGIVTMPVQYNGAPTVYENLIIVGTNGNPGGVRSFDARDGKMVWEFFSVPQEGEYGADTWGDGWRERAGAVHWGFYKVVDAERGLLYAVFDSPGPSDFYGGDRPGNNLFGSSVVALDVETGEMEWYFQTIHHDLWDYDQASPPALLDVTIEGARVPIIALAGKTGFMYILNRETGEPVFGIEERPVPAGNVPGEWYSPTQPIPVKPPPLVRMHYSPEDIVTAEDTTAEHAAFCRDLTERSGGFYNEGPFTPYVYRAPDAPPHTTILFPGSIGGTNWGGVAVDPNLGYVITNTMDEASIGWIEPAPEGARVPFRRGSAVGSTSRFWWHDAAPNSGGNIAGGGEKAWPCQKPPWGHLTAVDANTGDIAWKIVLGVTDELPEGKQNTGRLNFGGPITTAGGLVFIGATNDRRFRAFETRTGSQLWETRLPVSAHAVPVTYMGRDGKQYVAITAGGGRGDIDDPNPEGAEALVVFSLP